MNKDFNVYKWRREHLVEAGYQTYGDYERSKSRWGSPDDLKQDITYIINRIIRANPSVTITSIEDQSDNDGIKFEIRLSSGDMIRAFKIGNFQQKWELYFNGEKSDEKSIYFDLRGKLEANLPPFEKWKLAYDEFDKTYQFSDDPRVYGAGEEAERKLNKLYSLLSPEEKMQADAYKR